MKKSTGLVGKEFCHKNRGRVKVHVLELTNPDPTSIFVIINDPNSPDFGECLEVSLNCLEDCF